MGCNEGARFVSVFPRMGSHSAHSLNALYPQSPFQSSGRHENRCSAETKYTVPVLCNRTVRGDSHGCTLKAKVSAGRHHNDGVTEADRRGIAYGLAEQGGG